MDLKRKNTNHDSVPWPPRQHQQSLLKVKAQDQLCLCLPQPIKNPFAAVYCICFARFLCALLPTGEQITSIWMFFVVENMVVCCQNLICGNPLDCIMVLGEALRPGVSLCRASEKGRWKGLADTVPRKEDLTGLSIYVALIYLSIFSSIYLSSYLRVSIYLPVDLSTYLSYLYT